MYNLNRLFFVISLLCAFLVSPEGARAQTIVGHGEPERENQVKPCDGCLKAAAEEPQPPARLVFRSAPTSHRVASNRPTRLLPTHGGKPGKHHGRWAAGQVYNPSVIATLQRCCDTRCRDIIAASPRLRYVIALRRLLC